MTTDIGFTLNGQAATARPGESILQAAERHGVPIPHLCCKTGLRTDGNCRACVVEVEGERTLAPSCWRSVTPGMVVHSDSERAQKSQRLVLELLLANLPAYVQKAPPAQVDKAQGAPEMDAIADPAPAHQDGLGELGEVADWARRLGIGVRANWQTSPPAQQAPDTSHPAITVKLERCIQCGRCVRACREVQVSDVIGRAGRGAATRIVFDLADPLGASSCVGCGECVQACPTGALSAKAQAPFASGAASGVETTVDSVCPFCGVGCLLSYQVKDHKIVGVLGRDGPANHGRLCVKGRFGFDYIHHPQRLTQPLIRRSD
ncbi:MAG: 2Fe-2S iron-sulfur cluster-binding protein, partial [Rhodoferax sp.]|nr:2Fe-2S iron-sulfur cluster-binding protein [Rhodoferax sp.]